MQTAAAGQDPSAHHQLECQAAVSAADHYARCLAADVDAMAQAEASELAAGALLPGASMQALASAHASAPRSSSAAQQDR